MAETRAGLLSRRQIGDILQQRFYATQQTDSLRTIFGRLDIRWLAMGTDPDSGRGQVAFYDPLVVWVMATYFHWPRLAATTPYSALQGCLAQARSRRGGVDDEVTRRMAYYLFIADTRWGLDLRVMDSAILSDPAVLDLSLDGSGLLKSVLLMYKTDVLTGLLGRPVDGVTLAYEFDRHLLDGYDVSPDEWPFFGADTGDLIGLLEQAGLFKPASDLDFNDMKMTSEVESALSDDG